MGWDPLDQVMRFFTNLQVRHLSRCGERFHLLSQEPLCRLWWYLVSRTQVWWIRVEVIPVDFFWFHVDEDVNGIFQSHFGIALCPTDCSKSLVHFALNLNSGGVWRHSRMRRIHAILLFQLQELQKQAGSWNRNSILHQVYSTQECSNCHKTMTFSLWRTITLPDDFCSLNEKQCCQLRWWRDNMLSPHELQRFEKDSVKSSLGDLEGVYWKLHMMIYIGSRCTYIQLIHEQYVHLYIDIHMSHVYMLHTYAVYNICRICNTASLIPGMQSLLPGDDLTWFFRHQLQRCLVPCDKYYATCLGI